MTSYRLRFCNTISSISLTSVCCSLSCMTSYRLRFCNCPMFPDLRLFHSCRAWLLTVYGFVTFGANWCVPLITSVVHDFLPFTVLKPQLPEYKDKFILESCMTSYRLRFCNIVCWASWLHLYFESRAWLLTVYGFVTSGFYFVRATLGQSTSCMTSYRLRCLKGKKFPSN